MLLKATIPLLMLMHLFVVPSMQQISGVVSPSPVTVQLSTHQLSGARPLYYTVANKAVFVSFTDISVDIYDPSTNLWSTSTPPSASRGEIFSVADDYLVFSDKTATELLHLFDAKTVSWTTTEVPAGVNRYHQTVGNYIFYSINFSYTLVVYNIANNTWLTFEERYEMGQDNIMPIKYRTFAIFACRTCRTSYVTAWDTAAADLIPTRFDYGGAYRSFPSFAVAGDYFVVAGGVLETSYSSDFSIRNPYTGENYSGNMPSERYLLNVYFVDPLMLFVGGDLIEAFNLDTQQWQSSTLPAEITDTRVITGSKLFVTYEGQNYVVAFDSISQIWSNITIAGSNVGQIAKLGDLAAFVDSNSIVVFNPSTQQWTKAQFSADKDFSNAFVVGGKVLIVSTDSQTVYVTDLSQLAQGPATPTATPTTTVPWSPWTMPTPSNTPTASTPTTTVPWSPWTMPASSNTPSASPTALPTPIGSSVPTTAPSSSPIDTSSPVTVATPLSGNNQQATSSASTTALSLIMIAGVVLML
eukprot:TRINITY_DN3263_c0_g1_i4.p1 TRINITY_DN3263_c0_g1~~TRINITY_DN3263_c0_g1_i4.p1  ORF type:complete len:526 (+),score=116.36 TRINITY_DN3263_c0_g1_i4:86-1663(+)